MLASSPTAPMTVRNFPRDRCAAAPIFSISPTTRSIDACGALGFMTIITANSCTYAAKQPGVEKSSSVGDFVVADNRRGGQYRGHSDGLLLRGVHDGQAAGERFHPHSIEAATF